MSDAEHTADGVVDLIEQYSEIGISAETEEQDLFARVLFEIGRDGLAGQVGGQPPEDIVTALEVIGAVFTRIQDDESEAEES